MCTPASTAAAANRPGGAPAAEIICLCFGDNGDTTDYCKVGKDPTGLTSGSARDKASEDWDANIYPKCSGGADTGQLTPTRLASSTAAIISDLGKVGIIGNSAPNGATHSGHADAAIPGAHHLGQASPDCQRAHAADDMIGGASKGVCVDYNNLLQDGGYVLWMRKAKEPSMELDTIQAISSEGIALVKAAQAVKDGNPFACR
ncbi:Trypanosomal VSG domain containing protein, putative [Trypanosoma equiperdum]|uniref:Trypanosomal VSG domain containing protein, putative n=1 Tax=Trypanosoma equiperdum TaxID=5694 RepID=A0A1G4IAC6_TRYEQ|nr:Trypanosomal VSG domain containing protein, putative [Trypanosoma equiperdum]